MPKYNDIPNKYTKFLANTLHEIRTPIQTIIGTVELLSETHLDNEQTEYARQIQFSADVLLSLANDVLDFTKLQSHSVQLESIPFNPVTLTEQVIDLISIEGFNKGLEIVTDFDKSIPQNVTGDPTRVQQILLNLVKNAVKFTRHGYIHISLSSGQNGMILFKVTDSGIGIAPENRKNLFNDFYQTDSSTTRIYGGSGLGLSICRQLVTAMKGEIGVRPNPYGGSIFWFSLPLTQSDFPDTQAAPEFPDDIKILLVDDNNLALRSLKYKLNTLGIKNITTAFTGDEALLDLQYAARIGVPFTIAFIDMIMPVMDGWRLAADITADTHINGTKLFLVVPEGQMGAEAKMKILNWFNGYLYKPIKIKKLIDTLKKAIREPLELESLEDAHDSEPDTTGIPKNTEKETRTVKDSQLAAGHKILVAEDHPVNRKIVVTFLHKFGAEVFEAEDGQEAETVVKRHPDIELIFMDIQMPVKDGIEATKDLRKSGYEGIIIACTANNNTEDFANYKQIGVNDIIVKPFKSISIKNILEKWNAVLLLPAAKNIALINTINKVADESFWDEKDFLDTIGNNRELEKQLIHDYLVQTAKILHTIHEKLPANDFEILSRAAHTLRGSSAALSAGRLAVFGQAMEEAAQNRNSISFKENLKKFYLALEKVKILFKAK
jgi:CheY-like chemotaxis protein/HPt (histidine-containing phosphotransfer) domain-containing protein